MENEFAQMMIQQARKAKGMMLRMLIPVFILVGVISFIIGFVLGAIIF